MIELLFSLTVAATVQPMSSGAVEVESGSVLIVDGQRIRLWGLTTPEAGRVCSDDGGEPYDCDGRAQEILTEQMTQAREQLQFLSSQIHTQYASVDSLRCEVVGQDPSGEAVGRCAVLLPYCIPQSVSCDETWADLAVEVIGVGAGVQRREETGGAYDEAEAAACMGRLGVWGVADGAGVARRPDATADCS